MISITESRSERAICTQKAARRRHAPCNRPPSKWGWTYAREAQFSFGPTELGVNGETLEYQSAVAGAGTSPPIDVRVVRAPGNPDKVTLQLVYPLSDGAGMFRASTYKTLGDSLLTNEVVPL